MARLIRIKGRSGSASLESPPSFVILSFLSIPIHPSFLIRHSRHMFSACFTSIDKPFLNPSTFFLPLSVTNAFPSLISI